MPDTQTVARAIVAIGYALYNKRYSFSVTPAGDQRYTYNLESKNDAYLKLNESPGYPIEINLSTPSRGIIKYYGSEVAEITMSGSSGYAQDRQNSVTYPSISFSSSIIQLGNLSFQIS